MCVLWENMCSCLILEQNVKNFDFLSWRHVLSVHCAIDLFSSSYLTYSKFDCTSSKNCSVMAGNDRSLIEKINIIHPIHISFVRSPSRKYLKKIIWTIIVKNWWKIEKMIYSFININMWIHTRTRLFIYGSVCPFSNVSA